VFSREGFIVNRVPDDHAGGKWRLSYRSFTGQSSNLEVDLNFMFRLPLWDIRYADSDPLGNFQARNIAVIDLHELGAGKLTALLSRRQVRALFDCHQILGLDRLDRERLRTTFVVFGAMNCKDWRTVVVENVAFEREELARQLFPTLHFQAIQEQGAFVDYGTRLVNECRDALSLVLPFMDAEREFLARLLDKGEIVPELLTKDSSLKDRIRNQPLLEWKALNVQQHKGLT
jgi:hypothetical protein